MTARFLAVLGLASVLATGVQAGPARRKVIIDQDAFGGVNLQPLLLALQAPGIEVLGITVESGDGWQKESVSQTLRMLELIGRTDIPVVPGATYPLINSQEETRRWEALHGKLAYKGAWMESWPDYNTVNRPHYHPADVVPPSPDGAPTTQPLSEVAAAFLVRKVKEFPGEVSVLALGPFTNIALAAKLDEHFAANAKELLIMGGSFNPDGSSMDEFARQFVNNPREEFNSRWDPEAATIMLHAGWKKIVLVPLDPTVPTRLTPALAKEAADSPSLVSKYFAAHGQVGFPLWDETAFLVWLDPTLALKTTVLAVDVDIDHGANYGGTLSWPAGSGPGLGEPDVTVVQTVDVHRIERLFVALMHGSSPP